ncbi:hypothetical protein [Runella rosea]|uniref:hypothetical protein n=1 Tax=Runella rosea TaxID=2259595 RepID=UPI0013B4784B|nr:hypothetical protein [Runella rosea]
MDLKAFTQLVLPTQGRLFRLAKNPIVGYLLEGTVNGGGPDLRLESISNNVYVRRKD